MKIIVVFVLSFFLMNFLYSQEQGNNVERAIKSFVRSSGLENAAISFQAIDLSNNSIITSYNPTMALPPASITKLFSTATALELVGPGYQPKTRLYIDGDIDSLGVLHGNIWVRGGGDPSLGSRFFNSKEDQRSFIEQWRNKFLELGIKHVRGGVVADASDFGYEGAPEGWTWGDLGNYYGSGPSGLVLFDNTTFLQFETGRSVGDSTKLVCMNPHVEGLKLRNEVTASSNQRDNSYVFGAPFSWDRFIKGTLPFKQESFEVKASVPDPERLMAQELQYELAQDFSFEFPPRTVRMNFSNFDVIDYSNKILIHEEHGKTLQTIASITNMKSVNLFAEQLLCLVGYHKNGRGTTTEGIKIAQSYWGSRLSSGFVISDGSGLSRKNAFSANHFVELLQFMSSSTNYEDFKRTLPVAGKTGTLSNVCRDQKASGRIYAKSGTMSRIKAYSGYVDTYSGKTLAFAIIVNNHTISNYQLVKKMEPVFNAMAVY